MARIAMERSGEMEVFVRVVEAGGLSAAARDLGLTPSGVSKLLTRLEQRLGTRLLVRTTRSLTLTEEGEAFHRAAVRLVRELDEAEQAAAAGALRGRVRVNASVPFGSLLVVPAIPSFVERHPHVVVDLSLTDTIVDLVAERVDVAIRTGDLPDSGLVARRLGQSRRVVCASPAYLEARGVPRSPAELRRHDCLTFNFRRSRVAWPFRVDGRTVEQAVAGSVQVNSGEAMRQLALAGVGIARLGRFHVTGDLKAGALVPLLEAFHPGDVESIHALHVGGQMPRRVRALVDHLVETVARSPLLDRAGG